MGADNAGARAPMTLDQLGGVVGMSAVVRAVGGEGALYQHLLDMGVLPGVRIDFVKRAPMGDPIEFRIRGYELTLRQADAERVEIEPVDASADTTAPDGPLPDDILEHPGLGEGGRYHSREDENPLPDGTLLTFALVGNQNCGKTTLFNLLTGANQRVGNFPGVTVERKEGSIRSRSNTNVVDLPGIYSLSPYSSEEVVSREYILNEKPTGIINIVDATNLERNLYLTMQLMELGVPMVLAVNMMDEVQQSGGTLRINELETALGIPVVPISAIRNEGIEELVDHALHIARYQEGPQRLDFCSPDNYGGAVHRCLHAIMHLVEDHAEAAGISVRFAATKLAEGDSRVTEALALDANELDAIEHIIGQMESERGLERAAAIADMRYSFISKVAAATVIAPDRSHSRELSARIDRVLTGRFTAIPVFIVIMVAILVLTFNVIGPFFQNLIQMGVDALTGVTANALDAASVNEVVRSFVIDGVFGGVGTVLLFLPVIVTIFFFLSLLQDTGYMARVAFLMDRSLRRIGLSGRSIVPMVMGFGCTVPAVMATRTLPSERDRTLTILLTPFMSCATKLVIYGFVAQAVFPRGAGWVMAGLCLLGILVAVILGFSLRHTVYCGEAVPFVMELPNYRKPGARNIARLVWDKSYDFITRAFTVIFLATIVVWFLQSFTTHLSFTTDPATSMLAVLAGWLSPLFTPLGFGDWRFVTALVTGFLAKETVVSTLAVLFGGAGALAAALTPAAAVSFLVFCLLYTPCIAAIAAIRRELSARAALTVVVGQCVIARVVALIAYGLMLLIGL